MNINYIPYYCGGCLLFGLYSAQMRYQADGQYRLDTEEEIIKKSLEVQAQKKAAPSPKMYDITSFSAAPKDLKDFAGLLRDLVQSIYLNSLGTVIAVTNSSQTVSAGNLKALGFVPAMKTFKNPDYQQPESIETRGCITWLGDWHGVVKKRIAEVLK
jgi:hypothetical protein